MTFRDIPAPGFRPVTGKRSPPKGEQRYWVQLRNGWVDEKHSYTPEQLRWQHDGSSGDVVAVREA